jgi:hypothetical protein
MQRGLYNNLLAAADLFIFSAPCWHTSHDTETAVACENRQVELTQTGESMTIPLMTMTYGDSSL